MRIEDERSLCWRIIPTLEPLGFCLPLIKMAEDKWLWRRVGDLTFQSIHFALISVSISCYHQIRKLRSTQFTLTWAVTEERLFCSWFFMAMCFFQHHFICSAIGVRSTGSGLLSLEGKDRLGIQSLIRDSVGWQPSDSGKHGVKVGVKSPWAWPLRSLFEGGWCGAGRGLGLLLRAQEAGLVIAEAQRAFTVL